MSGYADHDFNSDDSGERPEVYLQKPFPMQSLMERIAELNVKQDQLQLVFGQSPMS